MEQQKQTQQPKNSTSLVSKIILIGNIVVVVVLISVLFSGLACLANTLRWYLLILILEGIVFMGASLVLFTQGKAIVAKSYLLKGIIITVIALIASVANNAATATLAKPVIYLYPTEKTDIKVQLDFNGKIVADYPAYDSLKKGWQVEAYPDGHLLNKADNQEYSYLFWEGAPQSPIDWNISEGFVVPGWETREFLQQTLLKMGLTQKEYNEFIVYWYPLMKDNNYNLIHFAGSEYSKNAELTITPKPDSMLRVFMVFKPLDKKIEINPQNIEPFERKGFAVIEWGGTKI